MLNALLVRVCLLSRVLVWVAGGLLLASALLVAAEVIVRGVFNVSIGGVDELSGYAFGIAVALGLSQVLLDKAHIRVDALYAYFPQPLKFIADVFGMLVLACFAGALVYMGSSMVADTLEHGSRSITPRRTPLAWVQLPWLFGWGYFLFVSLLLIACAIERACKRQWAAAAELIGAKSTDEQIADEKV